MELCLLSILSVSVSTIAFVVMLKQMKNYNLEL